MLLLPSVVCTNLINDKYETSRSINIEKLLEYNYMNPKQRMSNFLRFSWQEKGKLESLDVARAHNLCKYYKRFEFLEIIAKGELYALDDYWEVVASEIFNILLNIMESPGLPVLLTLNIHSRER